MSRHTGVTWHRNIPPASRYPTIWADRNTHVAQVIARGLTAEEIEANCNLIAAAPEMLEALRSYVELGHSDTAVREARAAIAKATGATP